MKQEKTRTTTNKGILPTIARTIGEKSVNQTCFWWVHQPKVPEAMKKEKTTQK